MSPVLHDDTIVAVSSPPGRGAISLLRLSGPQAYEIVQKVFRPRAQNKELQTLYPTVGFLVNESGGLIDDTVVTFYRAPRSFTGEDVVEISCHGSPVVVRSILECLMARGARLAEPGEFSKRAFFHGKMDLSQAEGIRDLIAAQTNRQVELALRQMQGSIARKLAPAKSRLLDIVVQLETAVEFVEEPVTPRGRAELMAELEILQKDFQDLVKSFAGGRLIREGWLVAIAGRPNVGKSSLFNRLVSEERAIVTEIPGTTRDTIRETIDLQGVPITLVDTAGIRQARGRLEYEGVRRSEATVADAHLVLLVLDAYERWTPADMRVWQKVQSKKIVAVWNKIDLLCAGDGHPQMPVEHPARQVWVSAKTGEGIDSLKQAVFQQGIPEDLADDDLIVTSLRHENCLQRSIESMAAARNALAAGLSEEFAVTDLRHALQALGEITGETVVEDILQRIFSDFCIGK